MKQDENLKEKFRQALISTFKVISDEFECKTEKNNTSIKDSYNFFNIESLSSRDDYMKLRAKTDSEALKRKFSRNEIYLKNIPKNQLCKQLYEISEKIRYEFLGCEMLKGISKNIKTPNWKLIDNNHILERLDEDSNLLPFEKHNDKESQSSYINTFGKKGSVFLKPITDGSSLDIYKISSNKQFLESIKSSSDPNRKFMIEEAIEGREFTMTIIGEKCYPPIEIITKNQFYDYDAKYLSNETRLEKALLNNEEMEKIMEISLSAFKALNCRAWGRVDLMQNTKDGKDTLI